MSWRLGTGWFWISNTWPTQEQIVCSVLYPHPQPFNTSTKHLNGIYIWLITYWGRGKAGNKEVLRRVDLAGGSWKHALHKREGQGYLKLAIFTSLPPICELLATCVMKSTFNHKKRTDKKNRDRFPELTHSVLHFSTTRLCLSCIHKQFIQIW